jgi:hypothetical protein
MGIDVKKLRLERYYGNKEAVQLLIGWCKQNKRNSVPMETLENALDSYNTTYNDYKKVLEEENDTNN